MSVAKRARRLKVEPATPTSEPTAPMWARVVNAVFRRLPGFLQRLIVRVKYALMRYAVYPTVPPDRLGLASKGEFRPAVFQLGFKLYADGEVVFLNRWGRDEVLDPKDPHHQHLVGLVHREYNRLVAEAKKQARVS